MNPPKSLPELTSDFWNQWYQPVEDESLRQGDIFRDLVVYAFPQDLPNIPAHDASSSNTKVSVEAEKFTGDWIILSASCDVAREADKYPFVLLAGVLPATVEYLGGTTGQQVKRRIEVIRKGFDPAKILLAENPSIDPPFPRSFVQYRPHLTMPIEYLNRAGPPQLRLRSPFREQFGNWVGANISRVGAEDVGQIPPANVGTSASDVIETAQSDAALLTFEK